MVVPTLYSLTYTDLTWVYSSSFKPQDMSWTGAGNGSGAVGINVGVIKLVMYDTVLRLIWGGAPMRFPKLK